MGSEDCTPVEKSISINTLGPHFTISIYGSVLKDRNYIMLGAGKQHEVEKDGQIGSSKTIIFQW